MNNLKKIFNDENGILAILLSVILLITMLVTIPKVTMFYSEDKSDEVEWIPEMGSVFETDFSVNLLGKTDYVNLNGLLCSILNQSELNDVVKLENGHLVRLIEKASKEEMTKKADELKRVTDIFREKGIEFLYVATPYAVSKFDNQLPKGYTEYTNSDIDYFLNALHDANIDYLDIREEMYKDGINQYNLWYKTDHHWTTEGGFYAFRKIVDYISAKTDIYIDGVILDEKSYEKRIYSGWHLGSYGQRTGKYYAGIDDFVLYEPKFDTSFGDENQTFCETMYDYNFLKDRNNKSRYTYDFTLEKSLNNNVNNLSMNNKTVLFLSDSMGKAVMPFLSLAFKNTAFGEVRLVTEKYLNDYKPDIIILLLFPHHLKDENSQYYYFSNLN